MATPVAHPAAKNSLLLVSFYKNWNGNPGKYKVRIPQFDPT